MNSSLIFVLFMVGTIYVQIGINFIRLDIEFYANYVYETLWTTGAISAGLIIIAKFFGGYIDKEIKEWIYIHHKQHDQKRKNKKPETE